MHGNIHKVTCLDCHAHYSRAHVQGMLEEANPDFAGAAGLHIKGTEFLTKAATEDETLEIIVALTQLYREQGWYLERMYKWCDRVGLDAIRKQVVDDVANRKALFGRFAYSQQFSQSDPWEARARRGVDRNEFTPLAELELA